MVRSARVMGLLEGWEDVEETVKERRRVRWTRERRRRERRGRDRRRGRAGGFKRSKRDRGLVEMKQRR